MRGENGWKMFRDYMRTWYDLGIDHVQFNVVSSSLLRAAQAEPQKYSDLVVRVAGYSAIFVEVDKELQEAIIARTEQKI